MNFFFLKTWNITNYCELNNQNEFFVSSFNSMTRTNLSFFSSSLVPVVLATTSVKSFSDSTWMCLCSICLSMLCYFIWHRVLWLICAIAQDRISSFSMAEWLFFSPSHFLKKPTHLIFFTCPPLADIISRYCKESCNKHRVADFISFEYKPSGRIFVPHGNSVFSFGSSFVLFPTMAGLTYSSVHSVPIFPFSLCPHWHLFSFILGY